uniref:Pheromone receptor n=1 Tax=Agrocybe salicacicola TaxID=1078488 RepID=A0A2P0M886_9AGAR|nr:pheromone receptor [Agrocybe salicacicola]
MQYPELPVFAFIAAILVLVPLPWHWRARNVSTLSIIFWLFTVDVIYGINAIVWAGNIRNPIPVWCDITTKFIVGASYALPLATLCICKHLEMVSSSRKVSYDGRDRKRRMIFEGIMCFLVPMVFMALHYIVQGHRYDIFENVGCQASVYISIQAVFIIWFPQLLFAFITFIYAALALHNFIRRRLTFASHLQNSNSALTTNRYLRLIAMALMEMVWGTTLTAYNLWSNVSPGLRPWTDWDDVHSNFSRVDLFATAGIPKEFLRTMMLFWWTLPASSFIFFLFFGFGEEAMKEYSKAFTWVKTTVLRRPAEGDKKGSSLFSSFPSNKGVRPLHLAELKGTTSTGSTAFSPTSEYHIKSPNSATSHLSQSTATLTGDYTHMHKKAKSDEAQEDAETSTTYTREAAPSYYASSERELPPLPTNTTTGRPPIGMPIIDTTRRPSLPEIEIDKSDTFTISTFYYGASSSAVPTPTTSYSPYSASPQPPSPSAFPQPPSPFLQHSLPPPPRRGPRTKGSSGSMGSTGSYIVLQAPQDVPEDVGPSSYTAPAPVQTLGVQGGAIMVTVQKQASVDALV